MVRRQTSCVYFWQMGEFGRVCWLLLCTSTRCRSKGFCFEEVCSHSQELKTCMCVCVCFSLIEILILRAQIKQSHNLKMLFVSKDTHTHTHKCYIKVIMIFLLLWLLLFKRLILWFCICPAQKHTRAATLKGRATSLNDSMVHLIYSGCWRK